MEKFEKLAGVAAPMPLVNIDTDMIIPKVFLKTIKRSGLGVNLFDEMRYDREGNEKPDFVLNKPQYRDAKVLVAGDNFGCGSSREHAPWAIADFGIKCVISTSFADIFYNNCFKNGVLPIKLEKDDIEKLFNLVKIEVVEISIDLHQRSIFLNDKIQISFKVDDHLIDRIIFSLDDIDISLKEKDKIMLFEKNRKISKPWIYANE